MLVTASDGSDASIAQLRLFLLSLPRVVGRTVEIIVLSLKLAEHKFDFANGQIKLKLFEEKSIPNKNDPYSAKLLLRELFSSLEDSVQLIYMDPDHIVFDSSFIEVRSNKKIIVSSEMHKLRPVYTLDGDNLSEHYNTSFISGSVRQLKKTTEPWLDSYWRLWETVPQRNLEELAFSLAAKTIGTVLLPCATKIQSSFAGYDRGCSVFHYGGDTANAKALKSWVIARMENASNELEPAQIPDMEFHFLSDRIREILE